MATKKPKAPESVESFQPQIHFNLPVNMPSLYATNLLIQATPLEVVISFYEVQPPLLSDDIQASLEIIGKTGVRADCIARITVAKERFQGFVDLISDYAEQLKK